MPTDYIPSRDADRLLWLLNVEAKIDSFLAPLGITAAEATAIKARCANVRTAISGNEAAKTTAKQAKENKDLVSKAEFAVLRNLIQTWKLKSTYTTAIGEALGLIASGSSTQTESVYKAQISAEVLPNRVVIKFVKNGADGVNVYARLKGQANWQKLAYDSHSPYEDNRPLAQANQPEHREYMAIGVIDDEEFGTASDIVEAVFGG